eukprot:TRINITY_DN11786_c0_g1_i1.p1 TRINITY_DN11786_c0_g1~~TRINITY_DN11786_c0_g1_i1.p1  ORF type:complete len:1120 (+),score=253.33 TRINITY_DN11786_c0_g1_i1:43-3402(+)
MEKLSPLEKLKRVVEPHTGSFNAFLDEGVDEIVSMLDPVEFEHADSGHNYVYWIENVSIGLPYIENRGKKLYPTQCRQAGITYDAPLDATICFRNKEGEETRIDKMLGRMPIMLHSNKCNLNGLSGKEMIAKKEEENDVGGYFIVNGIEKVVRMLISNRRNYPMALTRSNYSQSGQNFSEHAINIKCVRSDYFSQSFTLHFLKHGDVTMRFRLKGQAYFLPVIFLLRALVNTTDREIYEKLVQGDRDNTYLTDRVECMIRESKKHPYYHQDECLAYLGSIFRPVMYLPERVDDIYVGRMLLKKYIAVHLDTPEEKFELLIFMIRKLYALAAGDIQSENADSVANQEAITDGELFHILLRENLEGFLLGLRSIISRMISNAKTEKRKKEIGTEKWLNLVVQRSIDVGKKMAYFITTGNLVTKYGTDLRQTSGFCVVAEKINYLRFIAHFRCIHRGQFFAQMRTTSVRKLLPEAWGYLCPVHTPDGAPCGLLNHLALACRISSNDPPETNVTDMRDVLSSIGMIPIKEITTYLPTFFSVMWNGNILGMIQEDEADLFAEKLRIIKITQAAACIPESLEIAVIPRGQVQYHGVYLWSGVARFCRPVVNAKSNTTEILGAFEQPFLSIALGKETKTDLNTHYEISVRNILSLVASLTPFSDFNQSPRNMYQCQMAKQTMAIPCTTYETRTDNKQYRIYTPQTPIVRNENYDKYMMDDYLLGTNAIVAVLAYTGYTMEDACVINKSSWERGFADGCVYKNMIVNLTEETIDGKEQYFQNINEDGSLFIDSIDEDGLPSIGTYLTKGDPFYVFWDETNRKHVVKSYKFNENCYVDQITVIGYSNTKNKNSGMTKIQKVGFKLRYPRRPTRGDKFSSRHGQKGVLSQLWPQINMPFTESGMTPDLIINPHAFPSRMTIGMLIESMCGKAGALHGVKHNSSPFQYDEENRAVDMVGKQLASAGYNYYGSEVMYSGITGEEFKAEIFIGVVYYQRLRHMVGDKYQVRSTGPRNRLTRQPVKGRKKGGGIRFGEMERDSLLAHGVSYILHDRLMNSSDIHTTCVCKSCGSIISILNVIDDATDGTSHQYCKFCESNVDIKTIVLPWVYRYLTNELVAMNIRMCLDIERR